MGKKRRNDHNNKSNNKKSKKKKSISRGAKKELKQREDTLKNLKTNRYYYSTNDEQHLLTKKSGRNLYLTFNEDDRREFITGFRKRKLDRRQRAMALDEKELRDAKSKARQRNREQADEIVKESGIMNSIAASKLIDNEKKNSDDDNDDGLEEKIVEKIDTKHAIVNVITSAEPLFKDDQPIVVPKIKSNKLKKYESFHKKKQFKKR